MTIERLTKALQPERAAEEEAIEAVMKGFNADLLADMIERATGRKYLAGIEDGTRKIAEVVIRDLTTARGHDMA